MRVLRSIPGSTASEVLAEFALPVATKLVARQCRCEFHLVGTSSDGRAVRVEFTVQDALRLHRALHEELARHAALSAAER